jgi:Holliday junction resolvase RusA-like endonuclease
MKEVKFKIPGCPMSKQRHRTTKTGRTYTPKQTISYENLIKTIYNNIPGKPFWDCETMQVYIIAVFPLPKSYSKSKVQMCLSGAISPSTKDCDNIAKIVCDGLNNIAYSDDRHIVSLYVLKMYTEDNQKVGVYVHIQTYSQYNNEINELIWSIERGEF